jgi:hypothetical protein
VINNYNDDGERPEKIEAGLAFTIRETRIDCYFGRLLLNNDNLAGTSF